MSYMGKTRDTMTMTLEEVLTWVEGRPGKLRCRFYFKLM